MIFKDVMIVEYTEAEHQNETDNTAHTLNKFLVNILILGR